MIEFFSKTWFIFFGIAGFIFGIWFDRDQEKRTWNNGICKKSGKPWVYVSVGTQGKSYSDGEGNTCNIGYKIDSYADKNLR